MGEPAEKWENTKDVVKSVPEVPEVSAEPLGGEKKDVVVDLEAERARRAGESAALRQAKADKEAITESAVQSTRERIASMDEAQPIKHQPQWQEDFPTNQGRENPKGVLRRSQLKKGPIARLMEFIAGK